MDRNHPLHNVLQDENWESINKAPERMNTNQDNSLKPLESTSDNEKDKNIEILQHNVQKLKETIDALERVMNTKLNDQADLVNQVVEKMNKMIANYNELESRVNNIKPQTIINTDNKKEAKKEDKKEHKDTSTMEEEISCEDVSIEKMFNCSNKKF
jgi:hypothetical protein